jgi:hypothetical protein
MARGNSVLSSGIPVRPSPVRSWLKRSWRAVVAVVVALGVGAVIGRWSSGHWDPDAQLGDVSGWVSGLGTLLAVVVAVVYGNRQLQHSREQLSEERRARAVENRQADERLRASHQIPVLLEVQDLVLALSYMGDELPQLSRTTDFERRTSWHVTAEEKERRVGLLLTRIDSEALQALLVEALSAFDAAKLYPSEPVRAEARTLKFHEALEALTDAIRGVTPTISEAPVDGEHS